MNLDTKKVISEIEKELNYEDQTFEIEYETDTREMIRIDVHHLFDQIQVNLTTDENGMHETGTETVFNEVYIASISALDEDGNDIPIENKTEIQTAVSKYFDV